MRDAAIDRVPEPRLGLVAYRHHRIKPLVDRNVEEELGDVAGPENLVDGSKVCRPLLGVEVRGEYAPRHALPPQELACTAGSPTSAAPSSAAAAAAAAGSSSSAATATTTA